MTRKPQVLVVDDEANLRRMLGAVLGAEGYAVAEAASGTEACAAGATLCSSTCRCRADPTVSRRSSA